MQIYALLAKRTLWSSQAILPVLAFAASSALFLTVAGGVQALSTWLEHANVDHEMINLMGIQKLYMGLAWVAALVLIVPLFTLGASAARLSARRRDERLASLRLIGASTTLIVGLSVADALVYSLVGFIIGLLLYLVLIFPFGALHFMNVPLGAENMLLPVSVISTASWAVWFWRLLAPCSVWRRSASARWVCVPARRLVPPVTLLWVSVLFWSLP